MITTTPTKNTDTHVSSPPAATRPPHAPAKPSPRQIRGDLDPSDLATAEPFVIQNEKFEIRPERGPRDPPERDHPASASRETPARAVPRAVPRFLAFAASRTPPTRPNRARFATLRDESRERFPRDPSRALGPASRGARARHRRARRPTSVRARVPRAFRGVARCFRGVISPPARFPSRVPRADFFFEIFRARALALARRPSRSLVVFTATPPGVDRAETPFAACTPPSVASPAARPRGTRVPPPRA